MIAIEALEVSSEREADSPSYWLSLARCRSLASRYTKPLLNAVPRKADVLERTFRYVWTTGHCGCYPGAVHAYALVETGDAGVAHETAVLP
jgi:hypothetical protein